MVLIYSEKNSPRLDYILHFIFQNICGVAFTVTHSRSEFIAADLPKINYSTAYFDTALQIRNVPLLFEEDIHEQELQVEQLESFKVLFYTHLIDGNTDDVRIFPFDLFAASFYLITRYEEYLPHSKDSYGRYAHENSIAFREGFLQIPLVNIWVKYFIERLRSLYPQLIFNQPKFSFLPTYDIDIAYSLKGKGLIRTAGGIVKAALKGDKQTLQNASNTLLKSAADPFDVYNELDDVHEKYKLQPLYFFLVAEKNGVYDKNILPSNKHLQQLIKTTATKYKVGIHPSWQSGDDETLIYSEKKALESLIGKSVTESRQHYIRFNLLTTYRQLISAGITDDHSMGYGSINGFRASVATTHQWFDLKKNESTVLSIHPFCYMEANSFYEQKLTAAQAYEEMLHYYQICKYVDGQLITIWHNHMMEWRGVYFDFLKCLLPSTEVDGN